MAGLEWVPTGRGDSAWVESGQLTGTLVAEGDGWIDPPLSAWAGYAWEDWALLASMGIAAHNTVTLQAAEEDSVEKTRMLVMAARPGIEMRRYLGEEGLTRAWVGSGVYGVLPVVRYTSDSFTEDEQAAYDEQALDDRARITGVGGRASFGAEAFLGQDGDSGSKWGLGMQASWGLHRAQLVEDTVIRVSWRSQMEAAILLSFYR